MRKHAGILTLTLAAIVSIVGAFFSAPAHAVELSLPYRASGNTHRIAVTSTASTAEQLTAFSSDVTCTQLQLSNLGTTDAYVALAATAAGVATVGIPAAGTPASGILSRAGTTVVVGGPSQPYISAKTASGTTTLDATCGQGNIVSASTNITTTPASGSVQLNNGNPTSQTISSSTITTGGTFQTVTASSSTRKSFEFANVCGKSGNCTAVTNNCYLYVGAAGTPTTGNSIVVPPNASYLRSTGAIPTDAVQATCDGTGDKFYVSVQ